MSEETVKSLERLNQANSGGPSSIRNRLRLCRDGVAFHYLRESFEAGAATFSNLFIEKAKAKSSIFFEKRSRAYYFYAEQVRENFSFGFNAGGGSEQIARKLGKYLNDVKELMREVGRFLDALLTDYARIRLPASALSGETVKE
jgi:hypothetical protein